MKLSKKRMLLVLAVCAGTAGIGAAGVWLSQCLLLRGLTAELHSSDLNRALSAIPELRQFDTSGIPTLVAAALSSDGQIAQAAQRSIRDLLQDWQRDCDRNSQYRKFAQRLTRLAAALAHATASSRAPRTNWAVEISSQILTLTDRLQPGQRAKLVVLCDTVLDQSRHKPHAGIAAANNREQPIPSTTNAEFAPSYQIAEQLPTSSLPESSPVPLVSQSTEATGLPMPQTIEPVPPALIRSPLPVTSLPAGSSWKPQWNAPALAPQVTAIPLVGAKLNPVPIEISDRALLRLWIVTSTRRPLFNPIEFVTDMTVLQNELADRGFRDMQRDVVLAILSQKSIDRIRVVDHLLTSSIRDASNWLLLLAQDDNPQVRRAAISALITSRDRRILTLTHELALRDADPHVASLAPQIAKLLR